MKLIHTKSRFRPVPEFQIDLTGFEATADCGSSLVEAVACSDPEDAYKRVELDVLMKAATAAELVHFSFDQLIFALGAAATAEERGNAALKSQSLTRPLAVVIKLQMSVNQDHDLSDALTDFYAVVRNYILRSSKEYDAESLWTIQADFIKIRDAFVAANQQSGSAS